MCWQSCSHTPFWPKSTLSGPAYAFSGSGGPPNRPNLGPQNYPIWDHKMTSKSTPKPTQIWDPKMACGRTDIRTYVHACIFRYLLAKGPKKHKKKSRALPTGAHPFIGWASTPAGGGKNFAQSRERCSTQRRLAECAKHLEHVLEIHYKSNLEHVIQICYKSKSRTCSRNCLQIKN